ncbi:hypothetical protein ACJRO7_027723 [Eucalyptus globulus]|uniref:Uncharacterized protein n=1 Tax=Eucalyptus globulus TaxID=34317 RepID=A0ABD3K4Y4_EUCGL
MAAPPAPPKRFGIPKEITKIGYHMIHHHSEGLEYVLVKSTIWVDVGKPQKMPHKYRPWYRHYNNGQRVGPILEFDVPLYLLEVVFGKGTIDPKGGSVVDAKDPKLEGDSDSPVYSAVDSSWSEEEGEVIEEEEDPKEDPEEDPEED